MSDMNIFHYKQQQESLLLQTTARKSKLHGYKQIIYHYK